MSSWFPPQKKTDHFVSVDPQSRKNLSPFEGSLPHEGPYSMPWAKPFLWGGVVLSGGGSLFLLLASGAFRVPWTLALWAMLLLLMSSLTCLFLLRCSVAAPLFWRLLLVSGAFLLWGVDLLLASPRLASNRHDVVICLFVLSITVTMLPRLKHGRDQREIDS
jgi:hypothetical protein